MKKLFFIILSLVLIFATFKYGLYFPRDFFNISLVVFMLYFVWAIRIFAYGEGKLIYKNMVLFLLPLSYIISLPLSKNIAGSWEMIIKWTTYSVFFLMLHWLSLEKQIKNWMDVSFQALGIFIISHTYIVKLGWLEYPYIEVAGRLGGIFQYPNTFGMVMALYFLYSILMFLDENNSLYKSIIFLFPLPFMLTGFLLSYSKGMYLIFPVFWLIALFLLTLKDQITYILATFTSSLGVLATLFFTIFKDRDFSATLIPLIIFSLLNTFLLVLFKRYKGEISIFEKFSQYRYRDRVLPLTLTFFLVLVIINLSSQGLSFRILPSNIQDLVRNISLKTNTAIERKFFLLDGLKMSNFSPIVGFGGRGWSSAYKMFQQTPYGSKELHNGYLEWLVDNGWIGLIAFFSVLIILFYRITSDINLKEINKKTLAIILSLGLVFSHSFIDFNLSYGTVWFMILWLFVMGDNNMKSLQEIKTKEKKIKPYYLYLIIFTLFVVINLFMVFSYTQGEAYYNQAMTTTSLDERIETTEIAIKKQLYNSEYLGNLGELYLQKYLLTGDKDQFNQVESIGKRLLKLEPYNGDIWSQTSRLYLGLGDLETAQSLIEEAFAKDKYNSQLNEALMTIIINNIFKTKDRVLLEKGINYYESMEKTYKDLEARQLDKAFNSRDFHISEETKIQATIAYVINKDYHKAIDICTKNIQIEDYRLKVLLAYSLEQIGKSEETNKIYLDQDKREVKDFREEIEEITGKLY